MSERLYPKTAEDLRDLMGGPIGPTGWQEITQAKIDAFAELTGDRQWIHVDPERAAGSPFGSTMDFGGFAHSLNYGYAKVRFPSPLPVDSRIRMSFEVIAVEPVNGGIQLTTRQTFEREGQDKPVCVAESLGRFVEEQR